MAQAGECGEEPSRDAQEALKGRALDVVECLVTTCTTPRHRRGYANFEVARMGKAFNANRENTQTAESLKSHSAFSWVSSVAAQALVEGLPELAKRLLTSDEYKGGLLVSVRGDPEPDSDDLERNYVLLRAVVRACPTHVPSGFLVADAFLTAHELLGGKLLRVPKADEHANNVRTLALAHGTLLRRLVQRLRLLFRGSPEGAHSWKVLELKRLCLPKEHRRPWLPDIPGSWSPLKVAADARAPTHDPEQDPNRRPRGRL